MRRSARAFVVVALVVGGLAAVSSIAGARGRAADARDPERLAALAAMNEALASRDFPTAVKAWRQARELALRSRGWRPRVEAAEAELRLAVATDHVREAKPTARELFLAALFRARVRRAAERILRPAADLTPSAQPGS
jgi:hypothetical protein